MIKPLTLILFVLILYSCATPKLFPVDNSKISVRYKCVHGTIFNEKYPFILFFLGNDVDSTTRWTPSAEDIKLAEHILRKSITRSNYKVPNDYGPRVYRHWNAYFRQYVGYKNTNGAKVIYINALWDRLRLAEVFYNGFEDQITYNTDYTIVMDGGSSYWSAEINLDEKKLIGFGTNGIARKSNLPRQFKLHFQKI